MTPSFEGAKCLNLYDLFDSMDKLAHKNAKELCADCPVLRTCAEWVKGERGRLGTPTGTWAGRIHGSKRGEEHGNAKPREHGTPRGYHQHKYRGETACAPCREVMRVSMDSRLKAAG